MIAWVSYSFCTVLGLLVVPTVGELCWMSPNVMVPWVMYRVLLPLALSLTPGCYRW